MWNIRPAILHMKACWNPKGGHKPCLCEGVAGLRLHRNTDYIDCTTCDFLDETVIGWKCHWMKVSLDEKFIGWRSSWMKVSLDENVFGWKCHWMKTFLDESVSGWNDFGWKCILPDQHTGGSPLTPTIHLCPKRMAVGGSSTQHKSQHTVQKHSTHFPFFPLIFPLFFWFVGNPCFQTAQQYSAKTPQTFYFLLLFLFFLFLNIFSPCFSGAFYLGQFRLRPSSFST